VGGMSAVDGSESSRQGMDNQPMNATSRTRDTDGSRSCQAERCPLPPSLLPWRFERGSVTFVLWLCRGHGWRLTGERTSADVGGEAA
jgi:hypothetical protein